MFSYLYIFLNYTHSYLNLRDVFIGNLDYVIEHYNSCLYYKFIKFNCK